MPKFLPELLPALGALLLATGCSLLSTVHPGLTSHPSALVGEWIDVRHTSPGDTALWVLDASGQDYARRLVADSSTHGVGQVRANSRHAYWFVDGMMGDTVQRALCISRRPGRMAPDCSRFSIDTVATNVVRMVVHGYAGEHTTGDRTLLRRVAP